MLINNWKQAYKLWSVQCALAIALVNVLLAVLPSLQDYMTVTIYAVLNAVLAGGIAVLRVLSQVPVDQLKSKAGQ
ncbi:hypothetical protein J0692_22735 [Vibrio alginolyticus]|uniref:DUF7940 domain-containing protein n=1 Tax=Vibrio alginolyticus TaxID=663 RepID=UPI001A8E52D5|nr:hypothetical protein [Vibrio alginolyticus]MBO0165069.1 hypothetical protein [Vibrio alginolyticus]